MVVGGGARVCDSVVEMFTDPPLTQTHTHTYTHRHKGQKLHSELIMVPGEVFSIVGGLASHKHVPVFKDLLSSQHLILRGEDKGIASVILASKLLKSMFKLIR